VQQGKSAKIGEERSSLNLPGEGGKETFAIKGAWEKGDGRHIDEGVDGRVFLSVTWVHMNMKNPANK